MIDHNKLAERPTADQESETNKEIEIAKGVVVKSARGWADAADKFERNEISTEGFMSAHSAFQESLEELQQAAGVDAMLEVFENIEALVVDDELKNPDPSQ